MLTVELDICIWLSYNSAVAWVMAGRCDRCNAACHLALLKLPMKMIYVHKIVSKSHTGFQQIPCLQMLAKSLDGTINNYMVTHN